MSQFDDPQVIFAHPESVEGLSEKTRLALKKPDWDRVEQDLAWFAEPNRYIVPLDDVRYPELLKQIPDPPGLLFVEGKIEALSAWQVAIVGSRNPSASGRQTAHDFAHYLAQGGGLAITSGLATGIDAAAHQGALAAQGLTVAVVGTGLDSVYPAKHKALASEIAKTGVIVSEFALGVSPKADNFPRRNRIISGLSLGVLVVEAALRSGSLITARTALDQGREVFAIPGSIHNPLTKGCHQLIREGAKLVEVATDITEDLGALAKVAPDVDMPAINNDGANFKFETDSDYQTLFNFLGYDPIEIDVLIEKSGLAAEAVSSMLLLLELEGEVESLPGSRYVKIANN